MGWQAQMCLRPLFKTQLLIYGILVFILEPNVAWKYMFVYIQKI